MKHTLANPKSLYSASAIALAVTTAITSTPVRASESTMLEEILVTANKREQNMQDVGISVTAFSGNQLRELGYTNTIDIAQQTPNLNIIQFHPSITTVNIRGISQNEFADHLEGPIAMFVDNAYVSSMGAAGAQMFDIGRVEVLRGPQGTLFGRNATGGLIHYISAAPTEEFEGYFSGTIGNYGTQRAEGAVSGALTENLQGRLSGVFDQNDGTLENKAGSDLRDVDAWAVRALLAWQPADTLDINLKLHHAKDDSKGNTYQHDAAFQNDSFLGQRIPDNEDFYGTGPGADFNGYRDDTDVWTGQYDEEGFFKREVSGATINLSWDMSDSVSLTSVTDYLTMDKDYREDADASPYPFFHFETTQEFDQLSQELRLNGSTDTFRWQTGIYYLNIDTDVGAAYDLDFFTFGEGTDFGQAVNVGGHESTVETDSWAVFAQGEWDFTETLTAILGIRYSDDERDIDYVGFDNFFAEGDVLVNDTGSWDNYSYKAQLDWRPTDDTLYFAGVTRTHKAGNFRLGIGDPNLVTEHDEEVLTSYEAGVKTEFHNGLARLNANVFYYDYEDYQAFVVDPTGLVATLDIVNVDADAMGAEVELTMVPTDGLDILLGASWMDSEVSDVGYPDGSVADTELPFAPGFTANGLARYQWDMGEGSMSAQVDFNYVDDFCFSVLCAPLDEEDSYLVANARITYTFPNDNWSVTAFVDNFTEEEYRVYSLDLSGLGIATDTYSLPRMYGITLDVDF